MQIFFFKKYKIILAGFFPISTQNFQRSKAYKSVLYYLAFYMFEKSRTEKNNFVVGNFRAFQRNIVRIIKQ